MKIIHIIPGSGDTFYCENCLRDCATVKELRRSGEDVIMVPMYLPLFQDNPDLIGDAPVFFGGINVYLQQKSNFFRKTPRWFDRFFDADWLLKLTARKAGSTRADSLGDMTHSMLKGEEGNQSKELMRLINWLKLQEKPDLIHISNALLIGLADSLKKHLNIPVVCTLQDEDVWIDAMDTYHKDLCWATIAEKAKSVDAFIAVSSYFGKIMQDRINLPDEKLHIIPVGIDITDFKKSPLPQDPPVIGFLARMAESLGLGTLIDAFIILKKTEEYKDIKLKVCGGATADDNAFIESTKQKLSSLNMLDDVEFLEDFHRAKRIDFLQSLTVLSVPVPAGGAFGSYLIEAMGAGVPVIQPEIGSFPEIISNTGGGILYAPNTPEKLADTLSDILSDKEKLDRLGQEGQKSVKEKYSIAHMGTALLNLYKSLK